MSLSIADADRVARAYKVLSAKGPQLGRPVADRIQGSRIHNLKELRVSGEDGAEYRVLFVFDPIRQAFLLVGGNKQGEWDKWYKRQIQIAEQRYLEHLKQLGRFGI